MAENLLPLFADSGKFYVYVYRDPRRGKELSPIYVGKGIAAQNRANIHWRKGTHNKCLRRILAKIAKSNLEPIIEIVGWFDCEDLAYREEMRLIELYGRRDIGTGSLANVTDGGEGVRNWTPSPEYRETQRRLTTERFAAMSDEDRQAWLEKQKLAVGSQEHRSKLSVSHTGIKHTEETKAKIAAKSSMQRHSDQVRAKLRDIAVNRPQEVRAKVAEIMRKKMADDPGRASAMAKSFWAGMSDDQRKEYLARRGRAISDAWKAKKLAKHSSEKAQRTDPTL